MELKNADEIKTEIDPTRYDIDWWRAYWARTRIR